jgi:hypothetical protein
LPEAEKFATIVAIHCGGLKALGTVSPEVKVFYAISAP